MPSEVIQLKKAFTLIELLVVIAIIAILAAILFPVFAQAKAAAKKSAGTSNCKQLQLSILMYENDYDDFVPPATQWNPQTDVGGGFPLGFGSGWFANWGWLTSPYIKNAQIFYDPQVGTTPKIFNSDTITATNFPMFGYNYVYMSPWNGTHQTPISSTQADQPASTIMLAERGAASEEKYGTGAWWGFTFTYAADGPMLNATVEVPNCGPIPQFCAANWGVGDFCDACLTVASGLNTGGVAVRAGNQSIVSFMDGHVKAMSPGQLAVGTTWNPTLASGSLTWSPSYPASYLWSTNKSWTVQGVW